MSWLDAIPEIAVAGVILLAPGGLVVWLLGARGIIALGAIAPVSAAITGTAAVLAGLVGSPFSLVWTGVVTLAGAAAALVLRRWLPAARTATSRESTRSWRGWMLGMAAAVVLLGWRVSTSLIAPDRFSQHFDIVFHLNAVRRAIDGDGSSLTMGLLMGQGGVLSLYPAAWHDIAALVSMTTGIDHGVFTIPVAVSATNLVIATIVWPLGCMALVRSVAGAARPSTLVFAGVFAAAFGAFPLRMLDWGVVLPYFFGVALLPGVLALVIAATRVLPRPGLSRSHAVVLILVCTVGLALSHTSMVTALVVLSAPPVLTALVRRSSRAGSRGGGRALAWLWVVGYVAVVVLVWYLGRPQNNFVGWPTPRSFLVAIGLMTINAPLGGALPVVVTLAIAVTVVVLLRRRERWWFLGSCVFAAALFVVVAGVPQSTFRSVITGPWYEDTFRLAALIVPTAVVAASLGADLVLRRLTLAWRRHWRGLHPSGRAIRAVCAGVLVLILVPATQVSVSHDAELTRAGYVLDDSSELITPNEVALLSRIGAEVPADAVIANNPWDGSALAWALADRRVMAPHLLYRYSPLEAVVARHLRDAATDPDVCDAVQRLGIGYVLDFGAYALENPGAHEYPGLEDLAASGVVSEIDREGDAVLYRITACG